MARATDSPPVASIAPDTGPETLIGQVAETAGGQIGPYRLLEVIGEGGFGSVHLAEQTEPIRRRVALKIIKLGMDTRQVIARFEAERQALAMMDHPNIARVLDAGATQSGRPYFVMEWVRGIPITEFCDKHMLSTRDRLELLIPVCQAVQHAHQKGIIHRDLKPSNVLVTLEDSKPVPKVIDFGIAKAMHTRLTEKTVHTEFRQIVGTLEYMSPEQAEHSGLDVDTRADIYSLGVVMYELLTGETPFDAATLRSLPFTELPRVLMEREPPRPSTRIGSLPSGAKIAAAPATAGSTGQATTNASTRTAAQIARSRKTDVASLQRSLRGELDWIAMKCLEKDRTRRYASAQELGQDIGRYLRNEVVLAGPPSAAYWIRKFARRHRVGLAASGVVLLAVVAGLVLASVGFVKARQEAERARTQAARAEAISQFLTSMLTAADPAVARGRDTTLIRDLLADADRRMGRSLARMPDVEATLRMVMARTYLNLGLAADSANQATKAVEIRERLLGPVTTATLDSRRMLAQAWHRMSRFKEAEDLFNRVITDGTREHGAESDCVLDCMQALAALHHMRGRRDESVRLHEAVLKSRERTESANSPAALSARNALVNQYRMVGRRDEALVLAEQNVEAHRRATGEESPQSLIAMQSLAVLYMELGRDEQAERLFKQVLQGRQRVLGETHYQTLLTMGELGTFYIDRGRLKEAEPLLVARMEGSRRTMKESSEDVLVAMGELAELYRAQKRYVEAEPLFRDMLRKWRAAQGPTHPNVLVAANNLVGMYLAQERWAEAEQEATTLVANARQSPLADHFYLGDFLNKLGAAHSRMGRFDDAERCLKEAEAILSKTFDSKEPLMRQNRAEQDKLADRRKAAAASQPAE